MSRCFPFPPPGYEKTPARPDAQLASNLQQQLDKDKHKEKKHKKDKDRKEGKEKKDKDKHKDKHKDKKDRKEKHKDKKKEKAKDKSRESVEGVERHDEVLHDQKVGESSRKSEEFKDIKSKENFVRKIPDEKGASQPIENFVVSNDRSRGGFSAAPAIEKDRSGVNKMSNHSSHTSRKNEGLGQQNININQQKNGTATAALRRSENLTTSAQQRTASGFTPVPTTEERVRVGRPPSNTEATPRKEGIGQRISNISILVQKRNDTTNREIAKKEVGTTSPLLPNHVNTMPKGNGKVGRPMENTAASMHRFDSPTTSSAAAGMERGMPRSSVPSPSITIRRPNGMVRAPENLSVSTNKPDVGNLPPANWKEKEQGGRLLQANISTDHKLVTSKPLSLDKGADGRTERMEKVKDGAPKKEDKKSDRHEKKKRKEKDKHKEKKREKEAKKEKSEQNHKEHDQLRENSINTHQLKPSAPLLAPGAPPAPPIDGKSVVADEKKRKSHETNGYLQNVNDMRPTKLPRPALPSNRVENGTASPVAAPLSSVKPEAINIEKAERLHKKEEKVNGKQQAQQSSVDPVAAYENGKPSRKSPHPDCKYLSQIYSIPEAPQMMEWPEHEGEEWLFDQGSTQSRKTNSEPEADGAPKVWAQALKIDPADVIALPYVIPY